MTTPECEELESLLVAAVGGSERAGRHLAECPRCSRSMRELRGLVALAEESGPEVFRGGDNGSRWRPLGPRGGGIRAAALAGLLILSGWLLLTLEPVERRGVALRGVPSTSFGVTTTALLDDGWEVRFEAVPGATSYDLTVVSLNTGEHIVRSTDSSPMRVSWKQVRDLAQGGGTLWFLRAWDGVRLLAESPPRPVPLPVPDDAR